MNKDRQCSLKDTYRQRLDRHIPRKIRHFVAFLLMAISTNVLLLGLGLYYHNLAIPMVGCSYGIILGIWLIKNGDALDKRYYNNTNNISNNSR